MSEVPNAGAKGYLIFGLIVVFLLLLILVLAVYYYNFKFLDGAVPS